MQTNLTVLFIGDIVGKIGRKAVSSSINKIKKEFGVDFTVINIENSADGFGLNKKTYTEIEPYADACTAGNHTWDRSEMVQDIDLMNKLVRPVNLPDGIPGSGYLITQKNDVKILIINALGRIFMNPVDNPFFAIKNLLKKDEFQDIKIKIVDFHAEATSEKEALGWFLDGKVSAVIGTHTHVQTADERILPQGTAYISDAGMTGCHDGVLGFEKEQALERLLTYMPNRLKVCKDNPKINGCIVKINKESGKAVSITRINRSCDI